MPIPSYIRWNNTVGPVAKADGISLQQRWNTITPVPAIGKTNTQLLIPSFTIPLSALPIFNDIICWGQFNFTAGQNFTIEQFDTIFTTVNNYPGFSYPQFFAIRFTIAGKTTRYILPNIVGLAPEYIGVVYRGQIIPSNFVLEIWMTSAAFLPDFTFTQTNLQVSILNDPNGIPSGVFNLAPIGGLVVIQGISFSVPLPSNFPANEVWIGN